MSENIIEDISAIEEIDISEESLPEAVSAQFLAISEIDLRIQEAEKNCATAKEIADKMILAKTLNQKDAINTTQDAVRSIAESQEKLSNAQKTLFEYQQKMASSMRYLLMLGASNIAMSRIVISELEKKLSHATKEQLSENAREELINVIRLLKEQESAFSTQDRLSEKIKIHRTEIDSIHRIDKSQDETDKRHDELIAKNASKNTEQDDEISRQQKVDEKHDKQLRIMKILVGAAMVIAVSALVIAIIALI